MTRRSAEQMPEQQPAHPFRWLPEARQGAVFAGAALLTLVLMIAIFATNAPLQGAATPLGIVSLQLAGSLAAARAALAAWGPAERQWALLNLALDYPYLLAYATTLGLGCVLLARRLRASACGARLGIRLAWGVAVAALLDAVENLLLLRMLLGDLREMWSVAAYWCAVLKFGLVLATLLYLVIGGLFCLGRGGRRQGAGY